ncbi:MAG: dTDP-4-dehydrorhamnose reductase [Deltaproteobacteria bacterium]|nr:dTDP-4-dehydrorhamnose reductase [Deltaproteobacteria bacterium]
MSKIPTLLVLGESGQVAQALSKTLRTLGTLKTLDRSALDFSEPQNIQAVLEKHNPDMVINAVAYTAVDQAQDEPELAETINAQAVKEIASFCAKKNIFLIHYSTDYVFNGEKDSPYRETDPCQPINVYGATKLNGEKAIINSGAPHIILRTCWVYSSTGKNFVKTMLRLGRERDELSVVDDQKGNPTSANDIALATSQIVSEILANATSDSSKKFSGIYHLSGLGEATWFEFAKEIFRLSGLSLKLKAVTSGEFKTKAKRPRYSVLDNQKIAEQFHVFMPHWQESLAEVIDELRISKEF